MEDEGALLEFEGDILESSEEVEVGRVMLDIEPFGSVETVTDCGRTRLVRPLGKVVITAGLATRVAEPSGL